jgi:glycosyltransferase involved in cell wall biosynthesis
MSDARGSREPKEMRVALVTNFCPHYRRPLFLELSRRVDLTLIMTSRGNEWYWQGERPFDTGQVPAERAPRAFDVRQLLHRGDYEAVVTDLTGRATLLATVGTARRLKVPVVLWVGIWEHPRTLAHRVSRPLARKLYRSADAIVTYGSHVSAFVQRESGRTRHVFVAPQAVENERFRAPAPSGALRAIRSRLGLDDRPTFTFVGRVTEEKGLDVLVEASSRVDAAHQIVIAGTGPLVEPTRELASALGISDRVRFIGHVEQRELPALLQASDALVLPSVSTRRVRETWGLVVNEAMNCALPVVATDAVGAAAGGLVVNRETGLVVREGDAGGLAQALAELAVNEAMRHRFGEQAGARVLAWNYQAAADAFVAALGAAVEERGR